MPNNQSPPRLNRRRFLQGLTAAGAITADGYLLAEAAPWLDYAAATEQIRQPLIKEGTMSAAGGGIPAIITTEINDGKSC